MDWNYHINRPLSVNQNGEARHTRKYNQRTKEWNTKVVKVSKDFNYIPILMAKIFKRRIDDKGPVDRHISLSEDDPARIAPTILHKYHLHPQESYSLNTSQGFQSAKMIYFQRNSQHKPTMSDNYLRQRTCLCYTFVHNYYDCLKLLSH